jgi:homoserine acetyltransferase
VAGATCKRITEDPSELGAYPPAYAPIIAASCRYGQALGEAKGHYEETNSAGWDIANDALGAVGALTGNADASQVNPAFPGWWQSFLPPGALP